MEFSKRILITIGILTFIVSFFSLYIVWYTQDTSPLAYLIPSIFAEFATGTGFYYHKAKAENLQKITKEIQNIHLSQEQLDLLREIKEE